MPETICTSCRGSLYASHFALLESLPSVQSVLKFTFLLATVQLCMQCATVHGWDCKCATVHGWDMNTRRICPAFYGTVCIVATTSWYVETKLAQAA